MKVFRDFNHKFHRGVAAVGSFDGVHSGHRYLIEELNGVADSCGGSSIVLTFEPHPRMLFRGENRLLSTLDERLELLESAGARNVVVIDFTREFAATEAEDFARDILVSRLGVETVFIGQGHTFGRGGSGSGEVMERCGLRVIDIDRKDSISSTMVRDTIERGEMEQAAKLLGAPYLIMTPLSESSKLLPVDGRYLCDVDGELRELTKDEITTINQRNKILIIKEV